MYSLPRLNDYQKLVRYMIELGELFSINIHVIEKI